MPLKINPNTIKDKETSSQKTKKEVITYYLYPLDQAIIVNDRSIKYVAVSSHCDKHLEHGITHKLIMKLVQLLNNHYFPFSGKQPEKKNYFKAYPEINDKRYKLIWWWWKEADTYLWVRTCHPD
ncbi:hypothetical protein [endosymbiont GvMRE of Glomus versiforme]|uniref:hypothetical protein n=1 Tax=endosymbiont GvMRE of Glomus versiforme TaxID=2039283 RepID=UPI0011C34E63|nr:hypothetical protein [endosymbiont GvMRE of Glomus versiforme]